MSHYVIIKEEIKNAILGKAPFVVLDTAERSRARMLLREVATKMNREIDFYTDSHQFVGLIDANRRHCAGGVPYDFIEEQLKKKSGLVFAVADPKYIDGDNPYNRKLIDLIYLAAAGGSTIIVITADNIWGRLSSLGIYTKLSLPSQDERAAQIGSFVDKYCKKSLTCAEIHNAAMLLSGFTQLQLEIMIAQAHVSKEGLSMASLLEISKKKGTVYGKNLSVTQIFLEGDVEVAGLENLKGWLKRKQAVFFTPEEQLKKHDLRAPRGILLGGVPGCGKSLSAKMVAKNWSLPLYRFDLGAVFDKYVGESEKNMRAALEYIDNVSPCVLWVDEVEKMFAAGGESSDTARRLLGQFLFWLQESKSRIFLVATANNVDLLPPELFRKGRISEVFFLGLPKEAERGSAIDLYARRSLAISLDEDELNTYTKLSEGFSFADIENAIKDTAELLLSGQVSRQTLLDELKKTFSLTVPISKSAPQIVQNITQWGRDCAVSADKLGEE